jgi:hypothetical protein
MRVLVAAQGRSGSTLLYNIVRKIMGEPQLVRVPVNCKGDMLAKCHLFKPEWVDWADIIFTTLRDVRDSLVSDYLFRVGLVESGDTIVFDKVRMYEMLRTYHNWEAWSNFEFKYETYKGIPEYQIERVRDVLVRHSYPNNIHLMDISVQDVYEYVEQLPYSNEPQDITRLHPNHITNGGKIGGYKELMDPADVDFINKDIGGWLLAKGYMCEKY